MPDLAFTILPEGVLQLNELLSCLAKFDENVSLEAGVENLRISSLNISKTAHASFTLDAAKFFSRYYFGSGTDNPAKHRSLWSCSLQNRALLSTFRRRLADPRDKDTALERCEVELQAKSDHTECRIVIRMICRHGVVKTTRLIYESAEVLNATFDRKYSSNHWKISARTLRDVVEYFGPRTDQLDWYFKDNKVTFTSYTDKVQNGREILKQSMHTSVTVEKKDFDDFNVQEGLHIGIVVKDFRAIVAHAETLRASVEARYSQGNRPMQMTYEAEGLRAEFTLMTRGHSGDASGPTVGTPRRDLSVRPAFEPSRNERGNATPATTQTADPMPPPAKKAKLHAGVEKSVGTGSTLRNSPPVPSASINPNSLFIPDDNDQQWDEPDYGDEPDMVMWDNTSNLAAASNSTRRIQDSTTASFQNDPDQRFADIDGVAPTQRLSQVRGLFD